jgi:predicted DCC family thiol-disulfide oxidoreductase YuxK
MSESMSTAIAEPAKHAATTLEHPILFFDGLCGLCNSSVDFVMKCDTQNVFRYAPLQGETAAEHLSVNDREDLDSVVVKMPEGTFRHSSAIVRILWKLPGIWPVMGTLLWLIPRPLRNFGYRLVAKNRYRFFGKKETCRLPTPEEIGRLLP